MPLAESGVLRLANADSILNCPRFRGHGRLGTY